MKRLIMLVAGGLSILSLSAQNKIEFTEFDLDNGLHVILHEDHTAPIVAVGVMYHVGSKNEVPGNTGFAHFFEHLMFEGSENIGEGEYMKIVQANGGVLNANTSHDRTYYFEIMPSNQLELALWMESERMLHAKIDTGGVNTQREVVKEEKRVSYDNQPYMSFQEKIFDAAYDDHPYSWVPIGSLEDLNSAELDVFMDFYDMFYVPNNATLVISGDIDMLQARGWAEKYFKDIPKGTHEIRRPEVEVPAMSGERRDTVYDNIQLPAVFMGYRLPEQTSQDAYAIEMVTTLLSGGGSSRCNKSLVDEKELALQVVAFPYQLEDGGLFIALGLVQFGKPLEELVAGMDEEIARVQNELVGELEFQKLQNQIENQFVSGYSSQAGINEALATYHVFYGDANLINTEIERYRAVTPEDIQRVAKEYLVPENRAVLIYLPKEQAAQ